MKGWMTAWVLVLATQASVSDDDLARLLGEPFRGELVYLDYRSGREVSIPAALSVEKTGSDAWSFRYEYPEEPQANSTDDVTIADGGATLAGAQVVEKEALPDGVRIVTERAGTDDDRSATIRATYTVTPTRLTIRKDVRFDGENEWFMRNEFRFER